MGLDNDLADIEGSGKYVMFMLGEYPFALNIDRVKRIHDVTVEQLSGTENVISLHGILGIGHAKGTESYVIEVSGKQREASLLVGKVVGIKDFQLAIVMPFPEILKKSTHSFISSLFFDGMQMISELNVDAFLDSEQFAEFESNNGHRA